jgi:hypothetical protein
MSVGRSRISPALLVGAIAAALSCGAPSPVGVSLLGPSFLKGGNDAPSTTSTKKTGLVPCGQAYDSVTKLIGPRGDTLRVGPHIFWVDSLVLSDTVRITAVAPADSVRWVRFQPEGLRFPPNAVDAAYGMSAGALLYTNYKDCGVSLTGALRIAQVSDSLTILGYLQAYTQVRKNPWSQAQQFVIALLPHFSNYALAW